MVIAQLLFATLLFVSCAAGAPAKGKAEYEWKYGGIMSTTHPLTIAAHAFSDKLDELTDGRVRLTVYDNSSLGSIQEMIEGCDIGTIEFIDAAMAQFSSYSSKFYTFNLPYLFNNLDVSYAFFDGPIGQSIKGPIGKSGMSVVELLEYGFRSLTTNKRVAEPGDAAGLKIRTMPNKVHMTAFEEVGASPTPLAFSELFTALQQNVIDGQENPLTNIKDYSFYEVQKYLTLSEHFMDVGIICVNTKMYESLPADIRAAVDEALVYAKKIYRVENLKQTQEVVDFFKEKTKIEVIELTPAQKEAWKKAMSRTYDVYREEIGADYLNQVLAEVDRLQAEFDAGKLDTSGWR